MMSDDVELQSLPHVADDHHNASITYEDDVAISSSSAAVIPPHSHTTAVLTNQNIGHMQQRRASAIKRGSIVLARARGSLLLAPGETPVLLDSAASQLSGQANVTVINPMPVSENNADQFGEDAGRSRTDSSSVNSRSRVVSTEAGPRLIPTLTESNLYESRLSDEQHAVGRVIQHLLLVKLNRTKWFGFVEILNGMTMILAGFNAISAYFNPVATIFYVFWGVFSTFAFGLVNLTSMDVHLTKELFRSWEWIYLILNNCMTTIGSMWTGIGMGEDVAFLSIGNFVFFSASAVCLSLDAAPTFPVSARVGIQALLVFNSIRVFVQDLVTNGDEYKAQFFCLKSITLNISPAQLNANPDVDAWSHTHCISSRSILFGGHITLMIFFLKYICMHFFFQFRKQQLRASLLRMSIGIQFGPLTRGMAKEIEERKQDQEASGEAGEGLGALGAAPAVSFQPRNRGSTMSDSILRKGSVMPLQQTTTGSLRPSVAAEVPPSIAEAEEEEEFSEETTVPKDASASPLGKSKLLDGGSMASDADIEAIEVQSVDAIRESSPSPLQSQTQTNRNSIESRSRNTTTSSIAVLPAASSSSSSSSSTSTAATEGSLDEVLPYRYFVRAFREPRPGYNHPESMHHLIPIYANAYMTEYLYEFRPVLTSKRLSGFATTRLSIVVLLVSVISTALFSALNDDYSQSTAGACAFAFASICVSFTCLQLTQVDRTLMWQLLNSFDWWFLFLTLIVHTYAGCYSYLAVNNTPPINTFVAFIGYFIWIVFTISFDAIPAMSYRQKQWTMYFHVMNAARVYGLTFFTAGQYPAIQFSFFYKVDTHDLCLSTFTTLTLFICRYCYKLIKRPHRLVVLNVAVAPLNNENQLTMEESLRERARKASTTPAPPNNNV